MSEIRYSSKSFFGEVVDVLKELPDDIVNTVGNIMASSEEFIEKVSKVAKKLNENFLKHSENVSNALKKKIVKQNAPTPNKNHDSSRGR